jgi:hypothetical protein
MRLNDARTASVAVRIDLVRTCSSGWFRHELPSTMDGVVGGRRRLEGKFSCSNERWHRQCIIRSEGLHRGDLMHSPHRSTLVSASLRSAPAKSRSCSPGSPPTRRRSQLGPSTFRWARSTRTSPEFDRSTPLWAAARRRRPPFSHVRSRTVTLTCPSGESRLVTSQSDRRVESAPRFWIPDSDRRRLSQTGSLIRPFEVRRHNHIGR